MIARQQGEILELQRTAAERRGEIARLSETVAEQRLTIRRLEARLRDLEAASGKGGRGEMPGHKPSQAAGPEAGRRRKQRARGYGRGRGEPTDVVVHAMERCPDCGTALAGGTPKWSRQGIEVEPSPVQVVEHVFVERTCPACHRRWAPRTEALGGAVVGQQRLGIGLVSLVATLREVGRLPVRTIRWYLGQVHGLRLSAGAIVAASGTVAERGAAEVVAFAPPDARERVRAMRRFEERLLAACRPFLADTSAPHRTLCARIERHLAELFVFVAHPEAPPDNNAAERSLRHLVTSRKISGGTRSGQGTATKMATSSLFGTWRLQGLDPLLACRRLLAQPQI